MEVRTDDRVAGCVTAGGEPIRVGDVLIKAEDDTGTVTRGVVVEFFGAGQRVPSYLPVLAGDMRVVGDVPGTSVVSNDFASWVHVPRSEQTYRERCSSWLHTPAHSSGDEHKDAEEKRWDREVWGPLALLPEDEFDDENWPYHIEDVLPVLADHMQKLADENQALRKSLKEAISG